MRANKANLIQFLHKAGHFEIPVYQRAYNWSIGQCNQLWEDIRSLALNDDIPNHFLGLVVYVEKDIAQISSASTFYLVDGRQRLITISLFLAALSKCLAGCGQKNEILKKKINNNLLFNVHEEGNLYYKLSLNADDMKTYIALLHDKEDLPLNPAERIVQNYEFFKSAIETSEISPNLIFNALQKLIIIDVVLERGIDNPQLIFDSLNSTGLGLSQKDQIRNLVLMGISRAEQEEIYNNYWLPIENMFNRFEEFDLFNKFMRDYLTIQNNGIIPKHSEIYQEFNRFFVQRLTQQPRKDVVKSLYKYSRYFLGLFTADIDDAEIREHIQDINTLNADETYPFLMEVFDDLDNGLINKDILIEILKNIENFMIKKSLNNIAKDGPDNTFATLTKDINKMLAMKEFVPKILHKKSEIPEAIAEYTRA